MCIVKNEEQIDGIRKSCQLAAQCLQIIEEYVQPGRTTNEINGIISEFIRDNNAIPAPLNYQGYPKETCISLNDVICHGIPNDNVLKNGDIINIDVTTILDGYFGDTSRMYAVGEVSNEAERLMKITRECLTIGIEQVISGNPIGMIGYAITKLAHACGVSVVYQFVGHGTGLMFHEPPQIPHYVLSSKFEESELVLMKKGMVFTIEPMINLGMPDAIICEQDGWTARTADGSLSAQYEHTVLVTENGVEILTKLEEKMNEQALLLVDILEETHDHFKVRSFLEDDSPFEIVVNKHIVTRIPKNNDPKLHSDRGWLNVEFSGESNQRANITLPAPILSLGHRITVKTNRIKRASSFF